MLISRAGKISSSSSLVITWNPIKSTSVIELVHSFLQRFNEKNLILKKLDLKSFSQNYIQKIEERHFFRT